jgi:hypothetical protein
MNEQVKASEQMLSRGRRSNAFYFFVCGGDTYQN